VQEQLSLLVVLFGECEQLRQKYADKEKELEAVKSSLAKWNIIHIKTKHKYLINLMEPHRGSIKSLVVVFNDSVDLLHNELQTLNSFFYGLWTQF
jgi:hypothetical protein